MVKNMAYVTTARTLNGMVKQLTIKTVMGLKDVFGDDLNIRQASKNISGRLKSLTFEELLHKYEVEAGGLYSGKYPSTMNQFLGWKAKDCKLTKTVNAFYNLPTDKVNPYTYLNVHMV